MKRDDDKVKVRIRCSKCNSKFGYLRIKDKTWVCRSCGHENSEVVV